jgi:hypothetical protein
MLVPDKTKGVKATNIGLSMCTYPKRKRKEKGVGGLENMQRTNLSTNYLFS